jgi:uncharacterized protein
MVHRLYRICRVVSYDFHVGLDRRLFIFAIYTSLWVERRINCKEERIYSSRLHRTWICYGSWQDGNNSRSCNNDHILGNVYLLFAGINIPLEIMLAALTIHLHLPACASLKEKRGRLKPLLARLHREFNVSTAEMGLQDKWQEAVITCAMVGNDHAHLQQSLQSVAKWVEANWEDGQVMDEKIEIF